MLKTSYVHEQMYYKRIQAKNKVATNFNVNNGEQVDVKNQTRISSVRRFCSLFDAVSDFERQVPWNITVLALRRK